MTSKGAEIVEISEHTSFSRRFSALRLSLLVPLLARAREPPPKSLLPRFRGFRVAVGSCGCGESRSIRSRASTISWPRLSLRHSGIDDGLLRGGGGGVSELARLLAHLSGALPSTSKLVVMARGNAGLGDTCGCSISRSTSGLDDRRLDGFGEDSASSHSCRQEARRSSGSTGRTGCDGPASLTVTACGLSLVGDPNQSRDGLAGLGEDSSSAGRSSWLAAAPPWVENPAASHELVDLVSLVGASNGDSGIGQWAVRRRVGRRSKLSRGRQAASACSPGRATSLDP